MKNSKPFELQYLPWAVLNYDNVLTSFHRTQQSAKREAASLIDGITLEATADTNRWWKANQRKYGLNVVRLEIRLHKLDQASFDVELERKGRLW